MCYKYRKVYSVCVTGGWVREQRKRVTDLDESIIIPSQEITCLLQETGPCITKHDTVWVVLHTGGGKRHGV